VQNAAARPLTNTRRPDHITPVLRQLHWLPVQRRVHKTPIHSLSREYCNKNSTSNNNNTILVFQSVNKMTEVVFDILKTKLGCKYYVSVYRIFQLKILYLTFDLQTLLNLEPGLIFTSLF